MGWTERAEAELDFILDQIKQGKTAQEIVELRVQQRELSAVERGKKSEQRVIEALKPLPFITDVVKASRKDDRGGTDLWVHFDPDSNHRDIPVQVKSSGGGFFKFLSHEEKGKRRIIILVRPEMSTRTIQRKFLSRLKRFDGFI